MAWAALDDMRQQAREQADVCHLDDGSGLHALCLAPAGSGRLTCTTPGLAPDPCPDCGLPVCARCRDLAWLTIEGAE